MAKGRKREAEELRREELLERKRAPDLIDVKTKQTSGLCSSTTITSVLTMGSESVSSINSSPAASDDGYDTDEELRIAQQEWEENLRQLQLLFSIVLFPYLGKWLGRKWAHSSMHSFSYVLF